MIHLKRYTASEEHEWNVFVKKARNDTFLFNRSYMDYHSDRFVDHSLMYYNEKGRLMAVMPGNEVGDEYWSHQGLTYGGLVLSMSVRMVDVMEMIGMTKEYLRGQGFQKWYYKQIPTIYHKFPAEDDEYALWRSGAVLDVCNISTTIKLDENFVVEERRRRGLKRAEKNGYAVRETDDIEEMWSIVESNLQNKYGLKPVHTIDEMVLLKSRFPNNIRCFVAERNGIVDGGFVLYENDGVIHSQYPHATEQGKKNGVMDLIFLNLIEKFKLEGKRYFDFGTSNEQRGLYLNENLIAQKEGFGGRGIAYKIYKIEL